jgi:PTH1 family peptidyl-tRNA hydrolase
MIFIVGLGNPGEKYRQTRHNIGFVIVDAFLKQQASYSSFLKFNSEISRLIYSQNELLLLKPLTYMNNSGKPVASAISFYSQDNTATGKMIVIHDDIDIEFGKIRLKRGGGTGGHNGLESIAGHIGNSDFDRLRFGLGRPPGSKEPADFVLSNFSRAEKKELEELVSIAIDALDDYIKNGIDYAMNKYNSL